MQFSQSSLSKSFENNELKLMYTILSIFHKNVDNNILVRESGKNHLINRVLAVGNL